MRLHPALAALLTLSLVSCNDDDLGSARGELGLSTCDRGATCGCDALEVGEAIDFGSPGIGEVSRRIVRLSNTNAPYRLVVSGVRVTEGSSFGVIGLQKRSSAAANASVAAHDLSRGALELEGEQIAELILGFRPSATGPHTAELRVEATGGPTVTTLRGGGGASSVCVAPGVCGDQSLVDFGTFAAEDIGPTFDEVKTITIVNSGETELFAGVELVNDGIPELEGELVGRRGVFSLGPTACSVVPPGATLEIPVHYDPTSAGEHLGEVRVSGVGATLSLPLRGRVVGAALCLRTEDDEPHDALLRFGAAPLFTTAQLQLEARRAWVQNCGYLEDLVVSDAAFVPGSDAAFASVAIPWTSPGPLAPGAEVMLPFTYGPTANPGTSSAGRVLFTSNDAFQPDVELDLLGAVGEKWQCRVIASDHDVDFGWVATDEASQGCEGQPPFCQPAQQRLSRTQSVTFANIGELPCTGVTLGDLVFDTNSAGTFSVYANPNGQGFSLAPGESSQPVTFLFSRQPLEAPDVFRAKLTYDATELEIPPVEVQLRAKAGGSPQCALDFAPVSGPSLFCPSESLAFGNVNFGTERTIVLQVKNVGSQTCEVTNVRKKAGTNAAFGFPTAGFTIPVNEAASLPVTFTPQPSDGSNPFESVPFLCGVNAIEMTANSGASGALEQHTVALSGKGDYPDIDVIPGEIDFGEVTVGCCSAERRVAIYNSGQGTLNIASVQVLGSSDPGFTTTQPADTSLGAGEHTEILVRFCADAVGTSSGVVQIVANDGNEESFNVSLRGTGTLDNTGEDFWRQPTRPTVDVLWVIDDSGSMLDEQESVAANFDNFIATAVSLDTDYHMGVVSTDVMTTWAGKLYHCGASRFITSDQPQAAQRSEFNCVVKTTEYSRPHSDEKEAALQAGRLALDYPNRGDYNAGFLRDAAKLYVIMVTDEEDQSDGPAQLYVDFFRNLKGLGNPDLLNVSAISGPPPDGCATAYGNPKGYDAVQAVGGQFRSICASDWADIINSLGLDVFNARRQFGLSRPATASTLVVKVCADNGSGQATACRTIPQDAANGWTYDAEVNAVVFHGASVPGPGEHVQITYVAYCY